MASSSTVAQRLQNAKKRSASLLARGKKIEDRMAAPKTALDLVVATMNALALKKERLRAKGGAGTGAKIAKIDARQARLAKRRSKLEKRVAPQLARLEKIKTGLEKSAVAIQRAGG